MHLVHDSARMSAFVQGWCVVKGRRGRRGQRSKCGNQGETEGVGKGMEGIKRVGKAGG